MKKKIYFLIIFLGFFPIIISIILLRFFILQKQEFKIHAASVNVSVSLNPDLTSNSINSYFLGSSIEPYRVCELVRLEGANPTTLENIFNNLGHGFIRFGGNSVEYTHWDPAAASPTCNGYNDTTFNKSLIDGTFNFVKKIGRKATFSLNLQNGNPAVSADEAAYVISSGGPALLGIEIGNEPDIYHGNWTYAYFKQQWEAHFNTIKARTPSAVFVGPSTCCSTQWFANFVNQDGANIIRATHHHYPLFAPNNPTDNDLLSAQTMTNTENWISGLANSAKVKNLPLDMNETNAVADVPPESIGGTFAMSLWGLDYAATAAEKGATSMEFHGGIPGDATSPYNSSGNNIFPRPLYYGMLAFHFATGEQAKVVPVQISSSINMRAHAVLRSDGKLAVILVNKDQVNSAVVQIRQLNTTTSYSRATAFRLTAPSVTAAVNTISFAGSQVTQSGTWTPTQTENVPITGTDSSFSLPAASAAVIIYEGPNSTPSVTQPASVTPTSGVTPTPTVSPALTNLIFSIGLHGIGTAGDSVNPHGTGTISPKHTTPTLNVTVLNSQNTQVAQVSGPLSFNKDAGIFTGNVALNSLTTGDYFLKVKINGFLSKQLSSTVHITAGQSITVPQINLVNGDINNDDSLDAKDYGNLVDCFGSKQTSSSCLTPPGVTAGSDIDDDGLVGGSDYNLFLREISAQSGG